MPVLQNQNPAPNDKRVSTTTGMYLEIFDADNVVAASVVVTIDKRGDGIYETVYSGNSFQGTYTGSVDLVDPTTFKLTIDPVTFEFNAPVHLNVLADDDLANSMDETYWFQTIEVQQQITPVYPQDGEQLVSTGESVVIDFRDEDPLTVTIGGTLAYNDGLVPKFRNGYTGSYIDDADGKRLVLEPPSAFPIDTNFTVEVATNLYSLSYTFRVGTLQVTNTGDVDSPRITEATGTELWLGYIRDGELVLRKGNPPGAETTAVPALQWEHGYDPTLGKYVLYWIDNGKVFYSLADPTDPAEVLIQPSIVNAQVSQAGGDARLKTLVNRNEVVADPHVRGAPPDASLDIDITRPTGEPETDQITGFDLYTFIHGRYNKIKFVPIAEGESIVRYTIPDYVPELEYAVRPIYEVGGMTYEGPFSNRVSAPDYSSEVKQAGGSARLKTFEFNSSPPLQYFRIDDVKQAGGSADMPTFEFTSYEIFESTPEDAPKQANGAARMPVFIGAGFGIIGVG